MTTYCVQCKQLKTIDCTEEQYLRWKSGVKIQLAMPDIPPAERELLVSGICGECWRMIFRDGEDEAPYQRD